MTFPSDSMAWIAPIFFIVLLALFPLIGAIQGWKKSLYFGLGNIAFYFIGLGIWYGANSAIVGFIKPLLLKILPSSMGGEANLAPIINSVAAPVFFIIILILGNILLAIFYYAFVKKLMGLKKPKENKVGKVTKSKGKKVAVQAKVKVTNGKPFNIFVGGISFGVLMLPVTLTLSNIVAMGTTTTATRAKNSLCTKVYNTLQTITNKCGVCTYFNNGKAWSDFDGLLTAVGVMNNQISYTYNGKTFEQDGMTAMTEGLPTVVTDLANEMNSIGTIKDQDGINKAEAAYEKMKNGFDAILGGVGYENAGAILSSEGILDIVDSMIPEGKIELNGDTIKTQLLDKNSMYNKLAEALSNPDANGKCNITVDLGDGNELNVQISAITNKIPVTQAAFDRISDLAKAAFKFDATVTDQQKEELNNQVKNLLSVFLSVK